MRMTSFLVSVCMMALCGANALAQDRAAQAGTVPPEHGLKVVELFTSQACPNSPHADENLGLIMAREDVLALSLPVTYWDYFGWTDTLAEPEFDARQENYVESMATQWLYTPQMVINGKTGIGGDDLDAVESELASADAVPPLALSLAEPGRLHIDLSRDTSSPFDAGSTTMTFVTWSPTPITVDIHSGKNAGRRVTYHNVVRQLHTIAPRSGVSSVDYTLPEGAGDMSCAVMVQDRETGAILAAGLCPWTRLSS